MFGRQGIIGRRQPRAGSALVGLALVASVAGCHSPAERAQREAGLADQLADAKAYPAAAAAMARATALDADDPALWLKFGRLQLQAGDPGGADQAFQRAAELAPDNVEALENLAILSVRAGQPDRARRYMDPLLVLQPDDPAALLAQGAIALRERHAPEALATADRLLQVSPDLAEAHILRARALMATGRLDDAIALLRKRATVLTDGPDAIEVRALLVDAYRQAGDLAGVRATALELHRLQPDDPAYALESARALHAQGRDREADAVLAGLRKGHPGSVAIARAIMDYRRSTMSPVAARDAVAALAVGASPAIIVVVANTLTDMGAPARALALAAPLAAGAPTGRSLDAGTAAARAEAALGRPGAAAKRLDAILRFDSANVPALIERARLRLASRDFAGALADAQLAQSGDDGSQAAALLVARAYAGARQGVLAQQAYAQALQGFPDSFPVLAEYLDWLAATGHAADGLTPAASFARRHRGNAAAVGRYEGLCRLTGASCGL